MRILAIVAASFLMVAAPSFAAGPAKVTITNKLVDGKKTWTPVESKVPAGKVELDLVNTLNEPHGFTAPGLTEDIVVNAHETKKVTVDAKKGTYKFHCQLHPAHVGGDIVVD
jgi:plastocyanin